MINERLIVILLCLEEFYYYFLNIKSEEHYYGHGYIINTQRSTCWSNGEIAEKMVQSYIVICE